MIKFINRFTGTEMWVADDRVDEYKAAGHQPAVVVVEAEEKTTETVTEEKPKKAATKRTRKAR